MPALYPRVLSRLGYAGGISPGVPALDRPGRPVILPAMDNAELLDQIRRLSARIDALAERCQQLAEENRSLRHQQEQLTGERSQLLAKNEQARSRVEAMISRLKSLEQHT